MPLISKQTIAEMLSIILQYLHLFWNLVNWCFCFHLSGILPEALATDCQKCTEKQAENIKKVAFFLITKKPELWDQLIDKYDPEKKYRSKYEEQVKKLGVAAN